MKLDREASNKLRAQFGITEETPLTSATIATAAEMRALRWALRLSRKQLAARLGCSAESIAGWETEQYAVRPRAGTVTALVPMLDYARQLGLLRCDPGLRRGRRIRSVSPVTHGAEPLTTYACAQCGERLRRKQLREVVDTQGGVDFMHVVNGAACGPVIPHDRRLKKPTMGVDGATPAPL